MSALAELDGLHPGLMEEDGPFEDVDRRSVKPGAEIDEAAALLVLPSDHRRGRLAAQPSGVQQVVIAKDADRSRPLQRGECVVGRTPRGLVEGKEPGRLAGAEQDRKSVV